MADVPPSVLSGSFRRPFAEQVAFFRGKLGNLVPTARWDDMLGAAHDSGFMVAGAVKADLLADLVAAVDRSIAAGKSLEAFRGDFRDLVARNGWTGWTGEETAAGRAWRTRIIYTTNAATSYSAGRLAQLQAGDFSQWVYRHNDSVLHPRPLHLAWNGLTLPPDDPFWQTHYPPSGWGCQCYVLGARSDPGARRLGGDPDKPRPSDWDTLDPKTGAPVGIDRGWDYLPGDTVSATVRAMARKTQQWEYTLAKSYMQEVPESVRDDLAQAYRALPSVADDVRRYANRILEGRTDLEIPPYRTLGLLTSEDVAQVAAIKDGLEVAGYDYAIDPSTVLKIHKDHGDVATEARRGQRAVTGADYARLPDVLNAPDSIEDAGAAWKTARPVIKITQRFGPEELVTIWEVRGQRKMLALQSMWVIVHRGP